jgi:hypothetical protein
MDQPIEILNKPPFSEDEWLKLIFLLNDTQDWLNEMVSGAVMQLPMNNKKRLFRKTIISPFRPWPISWKGIITKFRGTRIPGNLPYPYPKSCPTCGIYRQNREHRSPAPSICNGRSTSIRLSALTGTNCRQPISPS